MAENEMQNGIFLAELAHDMRAPLAVINGYANAVLDGTIPPERTKYYMEIIASESKRLCNVVESVLAAARLEQGAVAVTPALFKLDDAVSRAILGFERVIEEKRLSVKAELENASVFADSALIGGVITNLLENAVKYTPAGGEIIVSVSDAGEKVRFTVENTCQAISQEELNRLTERFYRAQNATESGEKGTGLGLYTVSAVLALHNERLEIRNSGGFISFSFCLKK